MNLRAYVTEFIGTFFLVLTIGLVVTGSQTDSPILLAPLAIGSVLMVMVYMGGHVSGAHYNPAVSLAVMLRGKLPAAEIVPYIIAQIAGAIVASLASRYLSGLTFAPSPAANASFMQALLVEFLFTFALCLVVLNVATSPATKGNSYFGLAIGFTVFVGAVAGGGISGGAFNPAVGTGPILIDVLMGEGGLGNLLLYWLGPCAGGAIAAGVFSFMNVEK